MALPLDGVRVLDFTWAQQGPFATVMLSDMGAEIIKVEHREGERGRQAASGQPQPVPYFIAHDRGKKSITLDVRRPEALEIVEKLVERVDVVVSNMRPGIMERLGLGYDDLRRINPRIVWAAASAYGPLGKQATRPGFDIVGQALGGIMMHTGPEGSPPMPAGAAIGDQVGAINLCAGILAGLVQAARTGEGVQVDVSLYGTQVALQAWEINTESITGNIAGKGGQGHPLITPRGVWRSFETKDGHLVVGGVNAQRFTALCQLMDLPELAERFPDDRTRAEHVADIIRTLEPRFRQETTAYWLERFEQQDIIGAPVQSYGDILGDPQAWENGYVTEMEHPVHGTIKIVGSAIQFDRSAPSRMSPPELGDHTEIFLEEIGYDWDKIAQLREAEVI
jgi:crotonobetainyl-CoA:carnitine CoA-transferase CaiB-like acyl-CoA transferase